MSNEEAIRRAHPAIREMIRQFINRTAESGITILIYFVDRSFDLQNELFQRPFNGKDDDGDGFVDEADEKVTNAKAGQSYHNYALAIDVVETKNGVALWKNPNWTKIGEIGESVGFEWGGRWTKLLDRPHFQFPKGTNYRYLLGLWKAGKVDKGGYLILP
jgi:peptidoglycan LD-endopeptidase CwlK